MSRTTRLRPAARREYESAVDWYERQQPGVGSDFYAAVEGVFDDLESDPFRYPIIHKNVRLAPVPGFKSYAVYYEVGRKYLHIISVFHQSRDPAVWQSRV